MKIKNKQLIEKYPFLLPKNVFTEELPTDYDYSFTWLDLMPEPCKKNFGEQMCEEIKIVLNEEGLLEKFRIFDIKEKYGTLHLYSNFTTDKLDEVIRKYENRSMMICVHCGKPTKWVSKGYILFLCDECKTDDCLELTEKDVPTYTVFTKDGKYEVESFYKKEMQEQWKTNH